ncbi:MAG: cysteine desulfurase [Rickettsiales bacterium]|nr:MAG: cysteine desulfurase [Rickettsiales bacterium]
MIYLDHNATTPLHKAVKSKMDEYCHLPLNPSSVHANGRLAKALIEQARKHIANLVGVEEYGRDYQITFTSSGTESNNLILSNYLDGEIFISSIEHLSIYAFTKLYPNVTIIDVDENGILNLEHIESRLAQSKMKKKLVSVMLANNETGILQPVKEIAAIAHKYGAQMHSDCVQAIGKIDINIADLDLDFATISSHKFGGPTGVGALVRKANFHLNPMIIGGGQERSLRSGSENVLAILGFGEAANIASQELIERQTHMSMLRDKLETELINNCYNIEIVGKNTKRLPNTSLIITNGKTAEIQLIAFDMKNIAISAGSACSSGKVGKSHVLSAMGYSSEKVACGIRISLGYSNTLDDINHFLEIYKELNK